MNMHVTLRELQRVAVTRSTAVFGVLTDWTVADWANALAGECGEVCGAVKRLRHIQEQMQRHDPVVMTEDTAREEAGKELGDLITYAALLANELGVSLDDVVRQKFNEVSKRYNSRIRVGMVLADLTEREWLLLQKAQASGSVHAEDETPRMAAIQVLLAMDLMEAIGFDHIDDGFNYTITEKGREALAERKGSQ